MKTFKEWIVLREEEEKSGEFSWSKEDEEAAREGKARQKFSQIVPHKKIGGRYGDNPGRNDRSRHNRTNKPAGRPGSGRFDTYASQ